MAASLISSEIRELPTGSYATGATSKRSERPNPRDTHSSSKPAMTSIAIFDYRVAPNGITIAPNPDRVVDVLTRFLNLDRTVVRALGARATRDVRRFALNLYDALRKKSDGSVA